MRNGLVADGAVGHARSAEPTAARATARSDYAHCARDLEHDVIRKKLVILPCTNDNRVVNIELRPKRDERRVRSDIGVACPEIDRAEFATLMAGR